MNIFGSKFKELRESINWSINKCSEELGVTVGYISHIENGRREPSTRLLRLIHEKMGANLNYLIAESLEQNVVREVLVGYQTRENELKKRIEELEVVLNSVKDSLKKPK